MKGLWKYLGILNFYRRFLLKAAEILAPFNDLLHGDIKGKALVTCRPGEHLKASKESLVQTFLVHSRINAELVSFTNASEHSVEATLQQQNQKPRITGILFKEVESSGIEVQRI